MSRRTVILVSIVATLFICLICIVPVAVWFGVPGVQTAFLRPTVAAQPPSNSGGALPTMTATRGPVPSVTSTLPRTATPVPPASQATAKPADTATPATSGGSSAPPVARPPTGSEPAREQAAMPEADIVKRLTELRPPDRDLYLLTEQLKKVPGPIPRVINRVPEPFKVGDKKTFWVNDQSGKRYFEMIATLRYATDVVYMWVEDGINVSDDAIRRSADKFSKEIYTKTRQYFGEEASPGIDADKRLHILNGKIPDVGGYFSSADTYPSVVNPYSNQAEMFYINVEGYPIGTSGYEGTLAHEFQHMIHANYDRSEPSWINEGFSELAARLNGYGGARFTGAFASNPNTQLNAWAESSSTAPHYGAAYLFASYSFDRFGAPFIKDIVTEKALGIEGYEKVLKKYQPTLTFEQVFQDWVIANYLDDPKAGAGRYGYPDIDVKVKSKAELGDAGKSYDSAVAQYGAEYIRLTARQPITLNFQGATTVQLVPTTAKSGQFFMWSNRGDNMTSTLTREIDLSNVQKATLQFAAWYDIEEDWDYAYVQVSIDGGKTWDILKTTHTTDSNPNGNAYGPGLTGDSVAKDNPQWSEETADLTAYAGKKIQLRFQMITDDAVNNNNLAVDDIRIPELNYREDFEQGVGGWQLGGWLRTNTWLPQRYLVQLIELRQAGPQVKPIPVGADGKFSYKLDGLGKDFNEAVLVVSAAAPVTTEKAKYSVKAE